MTEFRGCVQQALVMRVTSPLGFWMYLAGACLALALLGGRGVLVLVVVVAVGLLVVVVAVLVGLLAGGLAAVALGGGRGLLRRGVAFGRRDGRLGGGVAGGRGLLRGRGLSVPGSSMIGASLPGSIGLSNVARVELNAWLPPPR